MILSRTHWLGGRFLGWRACLFGLGLLGTGGVQGADITNLSAATNAPSFTTRVWTTKQGLPENTVTALRQTRDGYLWVGTTDGLARFNGVQFRLYGIPDGLPHTSIKALLEDRQGTLWVGTEQGLARRSAGSSAAAEFVTELSGVIIYSLAQDAAGQIWIDSSRGLYQWQNGKLKRADPIPGLPAEIITLLYADKAGTLWVWGTSQKLFQIKQGQAVEVPVDFPLPKNRFIYDLLEDSQGRLWISPGNGYLICRENGVWHQFGRAQGVPYDFIATLAETQDGTVWAGSHGRGVFYQPPGQFDRLNPQPSVTDGIIYALCPDTEGNLWVGTDARGLICLRPKQLTTLDSNVGLSNVVVHAITQFSDGRLVAATEGGIYYQTNGRFERQRKSQADSFPWTRSVLVRKDGNLWWGTSEHLFDLASTLEPDFGQRDLKSSSSPVVTLCLCEDRATNLWAGTTQGLWRWQDDKLIRVTAVPSTAHIQALAVAPNGAMAVGTERAGIYLLAPGQTNRYTTQDGLKSNSIRALYYDADGVLWIGTRSGGLSRLQDGKIVTYTTQEGLLSDTISQILEDDTGALWLGGNRGISRVDKEELAELTAGKITRLRPLNLGEEDGMLAEECSGGTNPNALKDKDGRLFFSTLKGIVVIDPKLFWQQELPPAVVIEELLVNGRAHPVVAGLAGEIPAPSGLHEPAEIVLPPGQNNIEFHYTGLHAKAPESIAFRYQWGDHDLEWVNVDARRFVNFTKLAPGHYRFHVQAANQDGGWPQSGATLRLYVQPYFYQTWWLQIGVAGLGALILALLVRYLVKRRILHRLHMLELERTLENERRRIARDLHDELGARMTGIAHLGELAIRNTQSADEMKQQVGAITNRVQQLMGAMDEVVWTINPKNDSLPNMVNFLTDYAERFLAVTGIHWRLGGDLEFPPLPVSAQSRHNLLLAAKETLNNAVRHASATLIQLDIHIDNGGLAVVIADNGQGFDTTNPRAGGNGLKNIHSRMELIKGRAEISSQPGKGTITTLWIPLPPLPADK